MNKQGGIGMEKVILTKEQAEAIDEIKDIDYAINIHSFNKRPDSPLVDMSTARLARALFVGYEVEPEFLIGDTVIHKEMGTIEKVDGYMAAILEKYHGKYRHATPSEIAAEKERRFFARHGREPWELHANDTLICDKLPRIVEKVVDFEEKTVIFTDGDWEYFDNVIEEYKVLCFAENRLDVKTNE